MEFSSSPSPMGSGKRAPPPPIRIAQSSYTPPNYVSSRRGSASTLLYDMPSASPRKMEYGSANNRHSQSRILSSPPATEQLLYSIPAPGSPPVRVIGPPVRNSTMSPRRSVYAQSPPPPPARSRGSTSLLPEPTQKELDEYEALCRQLYVFSVLHFCLLPGVAHVNLISCSAPLKLLCAR
jgi:hypothetical protein